MKKTFFVLFFLVLSIISSEVCGKSSDSLEAPVLISPLNNSVIISDTLFDWTPVLGATSYYIQFIMGINVIADSTLSADSIRMNFTNVPAASDIYWRVKALNQQGSGPYSQLWRFIVMPAGIKKISGSSPNGFYINPNYPNPFNNETVIEFGIPLNSYSDFISLQIFDIQGRLIETLINEVIAGGKYMEDGMPENIRAVFIFADYPAIIILKSEKWF